MDGGQHGPPRREVWSYHHLPSKPIRHTSPLDMPLELKDLTPLNAIARDAAPGDMKGDGVKEIWSLAKP